MVIVALRRGSLRLVAEAELKVFTRSIGVFDWRCHFYQYYILSFVE
jgi:hypothetical protein